MRVKYIGKDLVALTKGKIYDVISVENGWYRIMTELGEDYLFPPAVFEIMLKKRSFQVKSTVSPGNR